MIDTSRVENLQKLLIELRTTSGPYWTDRCGHSEESYLFSFTHTYVSQGEVIKEKIDVYLFDGVIEQSFCLRYGDEDSQYYSPGGIKNIIEISRVDKKYKEVVDVLTSCGNFKWIPND